MNELSDLPPVGSTWRHRLALKQVRVVGHERSESLGWRARAMPTTGPTIPTTMGRPGWREDWLLCCPPPFAPYEPSRPS